MVKNAENNTANTNINWRISGRKKNHKQEQ
jgi:hypothetical protein